jgi:hypothetical protein
MQTARPESDEFVITLQRGRDTYRLGRMLRPTSRTRMLILVLSCSEKKTSAAMRWMPVTKRTL